MKKFYTFLCALVLAVSANAEYYDLEIHRDLYMSYSNWSGPQMSMTLNDLDHKFGFSLYINLDSADVAQGTEWFVSNKEYGFDHFGEWSSVTYDKEHWLSSPLKDGSFTWWKDNDSLQHFFCVVIDTLDNTYALSYNEKPFQPTGITIPVAIKNAASFYYSEWTGAWSVSGSDDKYSVYFAIVSEDTESPVGEFTEADFLENGGNNMYIQRDGWSEQIKFDHTASISITESNDSTLLKANVLGDDGNTYAISMFYADPKPLYFDTIKATNLDMDTSYMQWGMFSLQAANEQYKIYISGNGESVFGTFTQGDGASVSITKLGATPDQDEYINVFSGSFTVEPTEWGGKVSGSVLGRNDVLYTLDLVSSKPEPTRQETITIDNGGLFIYPESEKFIIWANTPDSARVVSLDVNSVTVPGSFTLEDLNLDQSYVLNNLGPWGYAEEYYNIVEANFEITYDADTQTAHLTGKVLGKSKYTPGDIPEFTLDITAKKTYPRINYDTPNADCEMNFADYEIDTTYIQSNQAVIVDARNENSQTRIVFYLTGTSTKFETGIYNVVDTAHVGPMTITTGGYDGLYVMPTYFVKAEDNTTSFWFPVEGTVTVAENYVITVDAVNSYERKIRVILTPKESQAVENIEKATKATKRLENGMLLIEKNGKTYNAQGIVIK